MAVSVIVADDYPALRKGVRSWLEEHRDLRVLAEAGDSAEAVRLVTRLEPDVLVIDSHLPGMSGLDMVAALHRAVPRTASVVFSSLHEEALMLEAFGKGALGFVVKTCPASVLVRAVRAAASGQHFAGTLFAELPLEAYVRKAQARPASPLNALTPRERQMVYLAAEGHPSSAIASQLHISPRTVEMHRARMMQKLGLRNQTELIRFALRHGLLAWQD
jgi:DNA-binding NarL/FixJ family response regulator